jgi:hypothetical protein
MQPVATQQLNIATVKDVIEMLYIYIRAADTSTQSVNKMQQNGALKTSSIHLEVIVTDYGAKVI